MTYDEIIKEQMQILPNSIRWWPKYFYHFTNIVNALGILNTGWIYGRKDAVENELMETDNASPSVISISQNNIKEYARLYFRPRTPTQYHNEGYKPEHIRNTDVNANCPVPIFFFLDANTILNMENVKFSETSCAGIHDLNLLSGAEAFKNLPFEKIYHDTFFSQEERADIVKHRHAEIVRLNGFPIKNALKGIVCRSVAEKQTLLYLLRAQYPNIYKKYRTKIRFSPELNLFFNNGIFIKTVEYNDGKIKILFNDSDNRYNKEKSNHKDIKFEAIVDFLDKEKNVISRGVFDTFLDYARNTSANLNIKNKDAEFAEVEIKFDGVLMYKNIISLKTECII